MIPAFPLASYFEDGLLMISILSIAEAGILSNPDWLPKPQKRSVYHQLKQLLYHFHAIVLSSVLNSYAGKICILCKTEPPLWLILSNRIGLLSS
jgi:hypothetical protein